MSRFYAYLNIATRLIETYQPGTPFTFHLKAYFSKEKKTGSRDRRTIGGLCYNYFRVARAIENSIAVREKILWALFVCEKEQNELLELTNPELNTRIALPLNEKLSLLKTASSKIFPFTNQLSESIEFEGYTASLLKQPKVFARIRPGRKAIVEGKLAAANVQYSISEDDCLEFSSNTALDKVLMLNKDIVIQDSSSQRVFDGLLQELNASGMKGILKVWDSCAASGGKSILLHDRLNGKIQLTVSDIRENILINLKKRIRYAGINLFRSFVQDLSASSGLPEEELFDLVICDVPCTGSGTWSRAPEQLYAFDVQSIQQYVARQQMIAMNTIKHTRKNGLFVYITCSVFKEENEGIASFISNNTSAEILRSGYIPGYQKGSDTMYVAVFRG